ncbi:MAG: hypothetical protein AB1640_21980 [bacterium]
MSHPRDSFGSRSAWVKPAASGLLLLLVAVPFLVHRIFTTPPGRACTVCHEVEDPVKRWRASGAAEHHEICADCHFDPGSVRPLQINRAAFSFLLKHWTRSAAEPIRPPAAPIYMDSQRDPAYYSLVPNHRCFACKSAPGHSPLEQNDTHRLLINFPLEQPCKDCHSHDMRHGQPFYEKILVEEGSGAP